MPAKLQHVAFLKSNISSASLSGTQLNHCLFNKTTALNILPEGAVVANSRISDCDLQQAILYRAKFLNTPVMQTNLMSADGRCSKFLGPPQTLVSFQGSDFSYMVLDNATIEYCDFIGISGCQMQLKKANISFVLFNRADLTNADLSNSIIDNTHFNRAELTNADLSHSIINNSKCYYSNLTNTSFNSAELMDCDFQSAIINAKAKELGKGNWAIKSHQGLKFEEASLGYGVSEIALFDENNRP